MPSILKELTKFAEEQAERRKVDKQVFIWAVICFCDFTRKHGYVLVYKGKEHEEQDIQKPEQQPKQDNAIV